MKKNITSIYFLFTSCLAYAQTSGEAYIQTRTYLEPVSSTSSDARQIHEVQYFDALGRPKQIVSVKATPGSKDVVAHIEYDSFGNQTLSYLPVPQQVTLNGGIHTNPLSNASQSGVYANEKISSEKKFEASPLNRVLEETQVGNAWSAKPVKFEYNTNTDGEVKKYTASFDYSTFQSAIDQSGTYGANQLYKNIITDEDNNKTIEFKDAGGRLILLKRIISDSESADTYYVYNEYDQLAYIIPPNASALNFSPAVLDQLCYQFKYDDKNRMVERKNPGMGLEYMVYNKADQLILTQDTLLKGKGQWLFTKYDQFGRVVYTGITNNTSSRVSMQNSANLNNNLYETRIATAGLTSNGMPIYYTKLSTPTNVSQVLSINYYDSYPVGSPSVPAQILGQNVLPQDTPGSITSTKGMKTASYIKNIEDDSWTKSYVWYDMKGRIIGTSLDNHLGGYTNTNIQLDFSGVVIAKNTNHVRRQGENGVAIKERFIYDGQNRLKEHWHKVDDRPEELLTKNTYNEFSQLSNKTVGNNLQSIDYAYNIRGWMTDINPAQMALPDLGGKLFSYKIKYNQKDGITNPDPVLFSGKDVKPRYNGSISEVDWRSISILGEMPSLTPKRYGYAYDGLDRMTAGYYQNPVNPNSKESIEAVKYDLNGNITNLYRTSVIENTNSTTPTTIDNLEYIYDHLNFGNKITKINDHSNNPTGYEGGGGSIDYDANGNMLKMSDKNISKISYNYLNLPNKIVYGGIDPLGTSYLYRADGMKLQKISPSMECGIINCYTVTETTEYLDGFQYLKSVTNNDNGGGSTEILSAILEKSKYAQQQQAFTLGDQIIDPGITEPGIDPPIGSGGLIPVALKTPDLKFFPTAEGYYDYLRDQYIYQYKDHLGNIRMNFAKNGDFIRIKDVNDYYPFGMNHLNTGTAFYMAGSYNNYKYNGKELEGSGMYDYGARFYMPDIARWGVLDPLMNKYESVSPYSYVANNPVNAIDPDGKKILFVNGHYQRSYVGRYILGSDRAGEDYWGNGFPFQAKVFFDDFSEIKASNFIDGSSFMGGDMSGQDRYDAGYKYAKDHINDLTANMAKGETFKIVTHSEGSAYGAGIAKYLLDKGYKVSSIVHLSSDEGDEFTTPKEPETYQLVYDGDMVTGNKKIEGVDKFGVVDSGLSATYVHGSTRNKGVFKQVQDLKTVRTAKNIGTVNGKTKTWTSQDSASTKNKTSFIRIDDDIIYNQDGTHK